MQAQKTKVVKETSPCASTDSFGDLYWRVLDALAENGTNFVGCEQHCSEFTAEPIHFYIVTRMHFFVTQQSQDNDTAIKAQKERKKAKLVWNAI